MCTKAGIVKKTLLEAYSRPRQNGVNAITIKEGDQLIEAKLTSGDSEVLHGGQGGQGDPLQRKGGPSDRTDRAPESRASRSTDDDEVDRHDLC